MPCVPSSSLISTGAPPTRSMAGSTSLRSRTNAVFGIPLSWRDRIWIARSLSREFVMPFGDSGLVLNGEVYYGAGIGREFIHYGFDYNPDHPDGAREITSLGGFASLKIPVAPRVDLNLGYGLDDPDDDDLGGFDARYLKNTSLFGNVKVNVTRHFGWGLEVSHFITDRSAGELTGQRFTGSWWFIF